MEELEIFFAHATRTVDARLDRLIPAENVEPNRLHRAMRWSVFAGGKRFRPALLFAAGRAFGAADEDLANTAAAVEMIHAYSLIHDDLPAMDDDDLRRGRATCHKKFDEATAILAGDVLQTLAFQAIAEDENLPAQKRVELVAELARAAAKMVAGQQLDLEAEGKLIAVADLEAIHQNKTGAMISVAARAGALIAGANPAQLETITSYAEKLGLLFQVTDDVLDATQTTEVLGKTAGKDAQAEKATYVSLFGLERAREMARQIHDAAGKELKRIDKETDLLSAMAEFILKRRK